MKRQNPAINISVIAILTAITVVFTGFLPPIPTGHGYLNLGDVAIFFAALTFGPYAGLIAGGLGTALADIILGYAQWAPISLITHGLEGLLIGLIISLGRKGNITKFFACIVGIITVAAGYFAGGTILNGAPEALLEIVPNLIQASVGCILGLIVSFGVIKAYPPVKGLYVSFGKNDNTKSE